MALIGDVLARVRADVSDFQRGMTQAAATTTQFKAAVTGTTSSTNTMTNAFQFGQGPVRRLEFALAGLATQITGINPLVERLVSGTALFAAGTELFLPLVGTVAAVAGAYHLLTHEAAEAARAQIAASQSFNKVMEAVSPTQEAVVVYTAGLNLLQNKIAAILLVQAAFRSDVNPLTRDLTGLDAALAKLGFSPDQIESLKAVSSDALKRLENQADVVTNSLTRFKTALAGAEQHANDEAFRRIAEDMARMESELTASLPKMQIFLNGLASTIPVITDLDGVVAETSDKFLPWQNRMEALGRTITDQLKTPLEAANERIRLLTFLLKENFISAITAARGMQEAERAIANLSDPAVKQSLDKLTKQGDKSSEQWALVGKHIGRQFIAGLVQSLLDGQFDVKKALNLLANILTYTLLGALHIFSPSKFTMNIGRQYVEGLALGIENTMHRASEAVGELARFAMAPMQPQMALNVHVGAAQDPLSAARDAQWQRAFRESARVATMQGFRFG